MKTIAFFAALVPMGAAFGAWTVTGGDESPAEPIAFAKAAGHSHHCRKLGVSEEVGENNLFAWAEKHHLDSYGVGSPWTVSNRAVYALNERADRDRYFGGLKNDQMEEMMDVAGNEAMLRRLNERGGGMLFYLDNETPKSCFGHMWYVGFKQTVPAWHDYSQDRPCWYSDYDNDTAERNALTGDYHKRRTDAFRAPKPIAAPDPLTIREIRELEDFLLKGEFRFDPRVKKELEPGMVPVWAFQIDKVRAALERAAAR